MTESWIECQSCGRQMYGPLTAAEQQQVAANPNAFVVWCPACRDDQRP